MQVPGYDEFEDVLSRAAQSLLEARRRGRLTRGARIHGGIVFLEPRPPMTFIGDIHGDEESLKWSLEAAGDDSLLVFLGDYVDRGPPEGQVSVLAGVLELYLEGRAIPLRGNHEPPRDLIPLPHDYPEALLLLYGRERGWRLYEKSLALFDLLPHALVIEGWILALHGGPPTIGLDKPLPEYLGVRGDGSIDPRVLEEILWNDPVEADVVRRPSPRGAGSLWGTRVTDRALEKARAKLIVRGHEPTVDGYKWNHQGRVLTLFSRTGPPYFNLRRAVMVWRECSPGPLAEECIVSSG